MAFVFLPTKVQSSLLQEKEDRSNTLSLHLAPFLNSNFDMVCYGYQFFLRRELLRGPLYYVIVLLLCTLVFWRESPVGVVSLTMMSGGDGNSMALLMSLSAFNLTLNAIGSLYRICRYRGQKIWGDQTSLQSTEELGREHLHVCLRFALLGRVGS